VDAGRLLAEGSPAHDGLGVERPATSSRGLVALGRRVSPPRIAPLSEGLTLRAPGRGVPEVVPGPDVVVPPLRDPKLGFASRFAAAAALAVAATTAKSAGALPRTAPPRAAATSVGRLVRVRSGIPKTTAAAGALRLSTGPLARERVAQVEAAAVSKGMQLAAGAVHTWELDPTGRWALVISGDAARVAAFGRGGRPVLDVEVSRRTPSRIPLPEGTTRVAVWSLGRCKQAVEAEFGAVSIAVAPSAPVAVGWHQRSTLHVVDGARALGRGVSLRSSRASPAGLVLAAEAIGDAATVETRFPGAVSAVLIATAPGLSRRARPTEPDVAIAFEGAAHGPPSLFEAEVGQGAIYPVVARQPFAVSVTSSPDWRILAVIGLRGRAGELGASLHGRSLDGLISGPALTADGGIAIRFERGVA
jgi:hypothetical protein